MKFYYLEDIDKEHIQFFKTKKSALDWIKNVNTSDDYYNENIFTKEDIQVLLNAFDEIALIVGSDIDTHEH